MKIYIAGPMSGIEKFNRPAFHFEALRLSAEGHTILNPVIIARGKGNTKEGRALNKALDAAIAKTNSALADLPPWQQYIIDHYGIMRTGFGVATSRGIAMLSTYGGRCPGRNDCLLFPIPNTKDREGEAKHGDVIIPADFQKLTYGQFYDLTQITEADDLREAQHG